MFSFAERAILPPFGGRIAFCLQSEGAEKAIFLSLIHILETAEQEVMDELAKIRLLHENLSALMPKHILIDDIVASISYLLNLPYGVGLTDDIDHLGNRRLRSVGELLQNQIRIGLARLERVVRERMSVQNQSEVKPQELDVYKRQTMTWARITATSRFRKI